MDPGGSNDFLCQGSSRLLLVVRGYLRGSQGGGPVTCSLPVSNAQIFAALRIRRADACGKASLPRMQPTALLRSSALTTASVADRRSENLSSTSAGLTMGPVSKLRIPIAKKEQ